MAPTLVENLAKRQYYCYYNQWGVRQCYGGTRWHRWGRWLTLGLVLAAALVAVVAWLGGSWMKKRKNKGQNQAYPQEQEPGYDQEPGYEQQETYPQYQNNYDYASPPPGPPPGHNQGYYDAGDSKQQNLQGDYGPPSGPPPVAYQTHP